MTHWTVIANHHPFHVHATTLHQACTTAAVHLAALTGSRAIDTIDNLTEHPHTGGRVDHGPHPNPR